MNNSPGKARRLDGLCFRPSNDSIVLIIVIVVLDILRSMVLLLLV